MSYRETISTLSVDAQRLEQLYQSARQAGEAEAFKRAIDDNYSAAPDNLLYAAWFYRLREGASPEKRAFIEWWWLVPLALLNGLLFWWLSDERFVVEIMGTRPESSQWWLPAIFLLGAPLTATVILTYFTAVTRRDWWFRLLIGALLLAAGGYVLWSYDLVGAQPFQGQYLSLMALHLPLLAWVGIGAAVLAGHQDPSHRFAFLIKSLELILTSGLFAVAGGLFVAITLSLFGALNVTVPQTLQRLLVAGGVGVVPVVVAALLYDPTVAPAQQALDQGLSRLLAVLMRTLLPPTLVVLLVYLAFIPFNFREPFENRDVLIIYNVMLFAIIALLVGATPMSRNDLSPRVMRWVRAGIVAVAALAVAVSLYALVAILYRTSIDRLTPNRLAFIGWNILNSGLLLRLLVYQWRSKGGQWLERLHRAFNEGTIVYAVWTIAMIVALPWLFGIDQGDIEALPLEVQEVVLTQPDPVLLKCFTSEPIYLLQNGEKRWIDSIETFNERGYLWRDVRFVSCEALRRLPDGVPIPANAGPPPQP